MKHFRRTLACASMHAPNSSNKCVQIQWHWKRNIFLWYLKKKLVPPVKKRKPVYCVRLKNEVSYLGRVLTLSLMVASASFKWRWTFRNTPVSLFSFIGMPSKTAAKKKSIFSLPIKNNFFKYDQFHVPWPIRVRHYEIRKTFDPISRLLKSEHVSWFSISAMETSFRTRGYRFMAKQEMRDALC